MIPSVVRICAVLALLAGCTSTDEAPSSLGDASAAGGDASGRGISSSELAGQPMPGTQEDLEVSVGDRVLFDYDSSVLDPVATQTLDRQAAWLKQYPDVIVTVEGHADERGTREYNLALGDRRASAVKNYLVALQVSDDRILTISYGEERPADPGHSEPAWAQNRRAVTVVNTIN
ncbi:MAG TPA: peptidoglycan-associated lipoprotein Pal [Geminicoccaceae bacterium]|nr:peptidoglycan-associated lipoprotein Pal [Geminicoccaceae bacterium]